MHLNEYVFQPLGRLLRQRAFVICVVALLLCAGGLHLGAEKLKWHFRKLPLPLEEYGKKLDQLDVEKLGPYRIVQKRILPQEIAEELGANDYIDWHLEDTSVEKDDPGRFATVFVTYYTGNPDVVPHVPDWCYVGSGGVVKGTVNTSIQVPGCGLEEKGDDLPLRILDISIPSELNPRRIRVGYFFSVNGQYCRTRDAVRHIQNNLRDRYTYFSKVELNILGADKMTMAETLAGIEKLARKVVPVLWSEHWPNWAEVTKLKD